MVIHERTKDIFTICDLRTHLFKIYKVKSNPNKTSKHEYDVTVLWTILNEYPLVQQLELESDPGPLSQWWNRAVPMC